MRIKNEKEFNDYKANLEIIIAKGTDLGSMEFLSKEDLDELDRIKDIINDVEPIGVDKIIETVPTRNGYHLITRPFNKKSFYEKYNKNLDLHDNNPTLIYMNLKDDETESK